MFRTRMGERVGNAGRGREEQKHSAHSCIWFNWDFFLSTDQPTFLFLWNLIEFFSCKTKFVRIFCATSRFLSVPLRQMSIVSFIPGIIFRSRVFFIACLFRNEIMLDRAKHSHRIESTHLSTCYRGIRAGAFAWEKKRPQLTIHIDSGKYSVKQ